MTFEEVARAAAKQAESAVSITLKQMKSGRVYDEDDVTGCLVGSLATVFGARARYRQGEAGRTSPGLRYWRWFDN